MELVGERVPDRHSAVASELFDHRLGVAAIGDAVVQATQDARGVGDALLLAELRRGRVEHGDARALIERGDLERAAGAGRGLLEQEHDVAADQTRLFAAGPLRRFEPRAEVDQVEDLGGRPVFELEEVAAANVDARAAADRALRGRSATDGRREV